jgi:putative ATP-binding cassette transporter
LQPAAARKIFDRRFARRLGRLTLRFWRSPDSRRTRLVLALAIAFEFATVGGNVLVADVQRRAFDALQEKDALLFFQMAGLFLSVVIFFLFVSTWRIYIRQRVEMRWRSWLTEDYLREWMSSEAYSQAERHRNEVDNPDQRIAEDVSNYVASALGLSLSLLAALTAFASFAGLLWVLSGDFPVPFAGRELHVPGFMMWVAIVYAGLSMWLTHRVGRRLVPINFDRLRVEADFRFSLMRFRENVDAVAFSRGEDCERAGALARFERVIDNWWHLIRAQRTLTLTTGGIGHLNSAVPLLVAAPGFFAGFLTLGQIAQARFAYGEVSNSLNWFVHAYQEIAAWRASIERLLTLSDVFDATRAELAQPGGVQLHEDGRLRLSGVRLELPSGRVLLEAPSAEIGPGEKVAIVGPAGGGKTALMRAIAGLWHFGAGEIEVPPRARTLFLRQKPYLPLGNLRAIACYPAREGAFPDDQIREALTLCDLGNLAEHLDRADHWNQVLSASEQQRLGLARALLHRPDWIFLDEATSALDEAAEQRAYELLAKRLPASSVVTTTRRLAAAAHHTRRWTLVPGPDGRFALQAA